MCIDNQNQEKLRFGMVGGGAGSFIGDVHLKAARFDGLGELAAGCFSRDYEKSLNMGRKNHLPPDRIYRTYAEMAKTESSRPDGIDFVIVAAPNDVHYDCCRTFLEHGIHVVCDKPLCHTSLQAEELARIARDRDLLFAVTYTYSAMPAAAFMRDQLASEKLGRLLLIKGEYLSDNLLAPNDQLNSGMRWRIDPAKAGPSTCCADIGVHLQHLITYVTRLCIRELSADMNVIGADRTLDSNFTALVRYENDVKGHLWCSNVAHGKYNDLRVAFYGTKGSMSWSLEEPDVVVLSGTAGTPGAGGSSWPGGTAGQTILRRMGRTSDSPGEAAMFRLPAGQGEGYYLAFANIYRAFMTALIAKKAGQPFETNYPGVEDGIESLKFVEACLASSAANGEWVKWAV